MHLGAGCSPLPRQPSTSSACTAAPGGATPGAAHPGGVSRRLPVCHSHVRPICPPGWAGWVGQRECPTWCARAAKPALTATPPERTAFHGFASQPCPAQACCGVPQPREERECKPQHHSHRGGARHAPQLPLGGGAVGRGGAPGGCGGAGQRVWWRHRGLRLLHTLLPTCCILLCTLQFVHLNCYTERTLVNCHSVNTLSRSTVVRCQTLTRHPLLLPLLLPPVRFVAAAARGPAAGASPCRAPPAHTCGRGRARFGGVVPRGGVQDASAVAAV